MLSEVDTQTLRTLIREEIKPLRRRVARAERLAQEAAGSQDALREIMRAGFREMDAAAAARHAETLARLEKTERWIERRVRVERAIVGAGRLAVAAGVRRVLPFLLMAAIWGGLTLALYGMVTRGAQ